MSRITLPRLFRLTPADCLYLVIAIKELGLARRRFVRADARAILISLQQVKAAPALEKRPQLDLSRVSWALNAAGARVPWRADCLLRAMAADRWLRRHGHRPRFFLGVKTGGEASLDAHAWLECDGTSIVGGDGSGDVRLL